MFLRNFELSFDPNRVPPPLMIKLKKMQEENKVPEHLAISMFTMCFFVYDSDEDQYVDNLVLAMIFLAYKIEEEGLLSTVNNLNIQIESWALLNK